MTGDKLNLLPMVEFTRHFRASRLGRLIFPVGRSYEHPGGRWFARSYIGNFFVTLSALWQAVKGWSPAGSMLDDTDIQLVQAYGSAVGDRWKATKYTRRKYLLFGPKVEREYRGRVQPADADFLVFTTGKTRERHHEPALWFHTYDCGSWVSRGGLHLVFVAPGETGGPSADGGSLAANALRTGVPVVGNEAHYRGLLAAYGVQAENARKVWWRVSEKGILHGAIIK